MPLYARKRIVIEARQFTPENGEDLATWSGGRYFLNEPFGRRGKQVIEIDVPAGMHEVVIGDWIIREGSEFYPCKPDVFDAIYEPAQPPPGWDYGAPQRILSRDAADSETTANIPNRSKEG